VGIPRAGGEYSMSRVPKPRQLLRPALLAFLVASLVGAPTALAAPPPHVARGVYIGNGNDNTLSLINAATDSAETGTIPTGAQPRTIAISPDGRRAYVANLNDNTVTVVNTVSNTVVGLPILVGNQPRGVAVTPDGSRVYVANFNAGGPGTVSVIDTATNAVVGSPIPVGKGPRGIAITPDGRHVYVANYSDTVPPNNDGTVSVIDTATNTVVGPSITVGTTPRGLAITPDGKHLYVTDHVGVDGERVQEIDTATNTVDGAPIPVTDGPAGIAITPDGKRAYISGNNGGAVIVLDLTTNTVIGSPITVGTGPRGIAVTPDGNKVFVGNSGSNTVNVISTATNTIVGPAIPTGASPEGLAITPDQPPTATFTHGVGHLRARVNASPSRDRDGTIKHYLWSFGDGSAVVDGGPKPHHRYSHPGRYTVSVREIDNEGCSTAQVYTGQTMSCNGGPAAAHSASVVVKPLNPSIAISHLPRTCASTDFKAKVKITDAVRLKKVTVKLDGALAKTTTRKHFRAQVELAKLKARKHHKITVRVRDAAGDQAQHTRQFKVCS
jgi:YVTN family beta-propeller protein